MKHPILQLIALATLIAALLLAWRFGRDRQQLERDRIVLERQMERFGELRTEMDQKRIALQASHPQGLQENPQPGADLAQAKAKLETIRRRGEMADAFVRYAAFFRLHGLSRDQIQKFDAAVADHKLTLRDAQVVANAHGLNLSPAELAEIDREEASQYHAALIQILGPDGPQAVVDFDQTASLRQMPNRLAQSLSDTPDPLSTNQEEQLTALLATLRVPPAENQNPEIVNIDWNEAAAKASAFLSPPQMVEFKDSTKLLDRAAAVDQIAQAITRWEKEK